MHPTDVCKEKKGYLPSLTLFHKYKRGNEDFKKKYDEIIHKLPLRSQLNHCAPPKEYIDKIKQLKSARKTNAQIADAIGVHEGTIEKYCKRYKLKKPPPITCRSGLHPYPGLRTHCQSCERINRQKRRKGLSREDSKNTIIDRECSHCKAIISVQRIYNTKRTKYCEDCKKNKYYQAQRKYAKEKRPLLKKEDKNE
jgi:IS30 family transposase